MQYSELSPAIRKILEMLPDAGGHEASAPMLPRECYTSPEFFEFERRVVFPRSWVCVGREEQIPNTGDYLAPIVDRFPSDSTQQWLAQNGLLLVAVIGGGGLAALAGYLVGLPSLRLRGDYLAIVTLGFGEIIRVLILNIDKIGAARGLSGIPKWSNFFWVFFLAVIVIAVSRRLVNSSVGRVERWCMRASLRAGREAAAGAVAWRGEADDGAGDGVAVVIQQSFGLEDRVQIDGDIDVIGHAAVVVLIGRVFFLCLVLVLIPG